MACSKNTHVWQITFEKKKCMDPHYVHRNPRAYFQESFLYFVNTAEENTTGFPQADEITEPTVAQLMGERKNFLISGSENYEK